MSVNSIPLNEGVSNARGDVRRGLDVAFRSGRILAIAFLLAGLAARPLLAGDLPAGFALNLARQHGVPRDSISFVLLAPDGKRHAHREHAPMAPASNLKLVTSAAALDLLGGEFLLHTDLRHTGSIAGGVLDGDLVIVGRGDPGWAARFYDGDPLAEMRGWVEELRRLGVNRIAGRVVADGKYFDGPSIVEEWPARQLHKWYCAPSAALNLNDNCVDVRIRPASSGQIDVSLYPAIPVVQLSSRIRPTSQKKQHLYAIDRRADTWEVLVSGKFYRQAGERVEWVTLPDPTEAFLSAFRGLLRESGIEVTGEERPASEGSPVLVARVSRPVEVLLSPILKKSQNLYADCLMRIVGQERGEGGSFAAGGARLVRYLEETTGATGVRVRDGSGLSRENRLTAASLLGLLEHASRSPWGDRLFDSLAVAGEDGTLARRFRDSPLRGRLQAKTGYIAGVSALSGRVPSPEGPWLFSLLYHGSGSGVGKARKWQRAVLEQWADR